MPTPDEEEQVDKAYEELIARSNEFYESGNYEEALAKYDEALQLQPKQGLAWYMKGMTLFKMSKYDQALAAFDMASKLDAHLVEPLIGKAYVYFKLFRFEDAIRSLKEVFLRTSEAQSACLIGLCYVFLENEDEAVSWFKRALEKDKSFTLRFFDDMYTELVLMDENITADEKIAIKAAIDKLKKKLS